MNIINLTVIVDESNDLGKFYLSYLKHSGLIPRKILLLKKGKNYSKYFCASNYIQKLKSIISRKNGENESQVHNVVELINKRFEVKIEKDFVYKNYAE